ncbi:SDR family NAD(P)-dependent oxidoreductase [Paraburkholderia bryophila]|uniref:NAD(P)-dependent dehydrogenase (Short-subunit alcohol dehydrogenase family) n=1 Tax=Paraburkholderia bryophila TaxID=420952 RepID=A0A7Z0B1J3_9BURK|nr:SDR family oxidoreductase [Paraburkholderia bryophila]NYH16462.1 NAD(P)-dependent dehydrogenase (short-subunit alcohol dehydrogenase family) [Paraburkholderia bryophila]
MSSLNGKIAVISGGTTGIGLAIARRFVAEGAHVVIFGRRQAQLDEAVERIGRNVTAIQADATKLDDLDRVVAVVKRERGVVDIVVSNAALVEQASIDTLTPEHFDRTFDLNARSPVFLVQKLLPLMTRGGSIVLVSSAMHVMGIPGHTTYAATKAALRSYARTWAAEFKDRGIRVNTLSPGVTDTPMLDSQGTTPEDREALVKMYLSMIPIRRLAQPEEMANAAVFLASDQSSYMTGADLMHDGGVGQV